MIGDSYQSRPSCLCDSAGSPVMRPMFHRAGVGRSELVPSTMAKYAPCHSGSLAFAAVARQSKSTVGLVKGQDLANK